MENIIGFISSEMKFPTETSKKKKRYVTFICPQCGKEETKVYQKFNFINLCQHCAKGGFSTEDFIRRGKEHFGDKFDYSKTVYVNKRTKVIITCPVHGDFEQIAQEHLEGHGCNQCKFDLKKELQILPKETWLERIQQYPLINFKDELQIKNYHGSVNLVCKIHGEFITQLGQVGSSKHLCKDCAYVSHQSQSIRPEHIGKDTYLYYIYLPDIDMYKLGVTINLKERLNKFGNYQIIATQVCEYSLACKIEHELHILLESKRYKGSKKLIPVGSTELYKEDILKEIQGLYRSNLVSKIL